MSLPSCAEQRKQRPVWEQAILAIRRRGSAKGRASWCFFQATEHAGERHKPSVPSSEALQSGSTSLLVTAHNPMANDLGVELSEAENARRNIELLSKLRAITVPHRIRPAFAMDADDSSAYAEHGLLVCCEQTDGPQAKAECHACARQLGQAALYVIECSKNSAWEAAMRVEHCFDGLEELSSERTLRMSEISEPPMAHKHIAQAEHGSERELLLHLRPRDTTSS